MRSCQLPVIDTYAHYQAYATVARARCDSVENTATSFDMPTVPHPHRTTTVDIHVVHLIICHTDSICSSIIWHMDSICSNIHIIPDQWCAGSVGFYDLCDRCRRQLIESDTDPDTPEKKPKPPSKRRRTDTTPPTDGRREWPFRMRVVCRIIRQGLSRHEATAGRYHVNRSGSVCWLIFATIV